MKYKKKLIWIAAFGTIAGISFFLYGRYHQQQVTWLSRPQSGVGNREQSLQVRMDGKAYELSFPLLEVPWEQEKVQEQLEQAAKELEKIVLSDNKDLDHIRTDMNMPSAFPGTRIAIEWYLDSWEYVDPGGILKNAGMTEPCEVNIQAMLSLQEEELRWERKALICPPEYPDEEQKLQMLRTQVQKLQEDSRDSTLLLPDTVSGTDVTWYLLPDDRWIWILFLTAVSCGAIIVGQRKEEEQRQKERERNLSLGYPEIVSRLSLYMNAGVSTRKAWERIVENYEKKSNEKQRYREAYEEMRTALHEMQSGVSETLAYERFGTRCCLPSYLKLGTLLSQNLRKGTKNLAGLLAEESREAFEDRKAFAKKLGEECESKLLLPMLMLLLTVLIMVMYPAVVSFQM